MHNFEGALIHVGLGKSHLLLCAPDEPAGYYRRLTIFLFRH